MPGREYAALFGYYLGDGCISRVRSSYSFRISCDNHGSGAKHHRCMTLEPWQQEIVGANPAAFLRGLFHSDGCRVNNWATRPVGGVTKRDEYARWQFVNHSEGILLWCTEALDRLDIPWRRSGRYTISVSRREGVARLDDLIGPKA